MQQPAGKLTACATRGRLLQLEGGRLSRRHVTLILMNGAPPQVFPQAAFIAYPDVNSVLRGILYKLQQESKSRRIESHLLAYY